MNGTVWPSCRYRRNPETDDIDWHIFLNRNELFEAQERQGGWVNSPALVDSVEALSPAKDAPKPAEEHQDEQAQESENAETEQSDDLDFSGLDDDALRDIASKAGIKIGPRWGRARIEEALRSAK